MSRLCLSTTLAFALGSSLACARDGEMPRPAVAAAASAGSSPASSAEPAAAATGDGEPCTPLETRPANASGQRPAFPGQTRACALSSDVDLQVTVVARGLDHPWAVEPLPDGALLVTERPGRMRVVGDGTLSEPLDGLPPVDAGDQGGLLDVVLAPSFARDGAIYWSYAEPRKGGNGTTVARGTLSRDRRRLDDVRVVFRSEPTYDGGKHFGSRLVFGPDGMLYVTLGERSDLVTRPQAQALDSHLGKILRLTPDGGTPPDNPFVGERGARPEIWTLGHRNVQSAALDDRARLWIVEHGPKGGDEVNLLQKGRNFGWPVVTYGEEYSGRPIAGAATDRPGYERPLYYWDPVIAPSGAQFYDGDLFPAWRGNLFVGSLIETCLVRLVIEDDRVVGEEHLLAERGKRVRDVRQGREGALYLVTDEDDGELWRLTPARR